MTNQMGEIRAICILNRNQQGEENESNWSSAGRVDPGARSPAGTGCHTGRQSPFVITGNFVGEIRLGYEITPAGRRPIKGGSVSGNLFTALAGARFSQETSLQGAYLGPVGIRFPALTIAGE